MAKINKATLITGAAGFLGVHHCNTVLSIGNTLVMIDRDKKKLIQVFNKLKKNFRSSKIFLFAADIVNEKKIKYIFLQRTLIKNLTGIRSRTETLIAGIFFLEFYF